MVSIEDFTSYVAYRHGKTPAGGGFSPQKPNLGVGAMLQAADTLVYSLIGDDPDAVPDRVVDWCVMEIGAELWESGGQPPDLAPFREILAPTHGIGPVR